jgi:hypothetical protein
MITMFAAEDRERIREMLVARAHEDERVVAAAAIGASAAGGDRWSDLDLTFGVAQGSAIADVLADWTRLMEGELDAAILFDLPFLSSIYRVFLLPGKLQVDLSFTPADQFGALGPRFHLLFGEVVERQHPQPPPPEYRAGLAVHHLVRAHICIERGRLWQAEYWIHSLRDEGLALACRRHGLEPSQARGVDALPPEELAVWEGTLVGAMRPEALRHALAAATGGFLREGAEYLTDAPWLRPELEEVAQSPGNG